MHAKAIHNPQGDPYPDKIKNVEKNNKKCKKNKNDDHNSSKKSAPNLVKTKQGFLTHQIKIAPFQKSLSKSRQKSPLKQPHQNHQKMKLSKKLNTTPINSAKNGSTKQGKKSPKGKSKSRSLSTSRKNTAKMTHREYNEVSPLQNTKKQLFQSWKKEKMSPGKPKPKSKEKKKGQYLNQNKLLKKQDNQYEDKTFQNVEGQLTYQLTSANNQDVQQQQKKKSKREIPQIRTQFSGRKKSYIDQSLLRKLEHHRSNKNFEFIESCFVRSVQQQSKHQQSRREKIKQKDNNNNNRNSTNRNSTESLKIATFRKEQEKKWCAMLQQIQKLKNQAQISDKIDFLIQQITDNYNNLQMHITSDSESSKKQLQQRQQTKGDEFQHLQAQCDLTYPLIPNSSQNESQSVVQHQAQNTDCLKIDQPRSNIISLDDFFHSSQNKTTLNMKRDIFNDQPDPTRASILKQMKEMVKNEMDQLKKEREVTHVDIRDQNIAVNPIEPNHQSESNELNKLSNIHLNAQLIFQQIFSNLILQLCTTILKNKNFLHHLLTSFSSHAPLPSHPQHDFSYLMQPSSNDYACHLLQRILNYLFTHRRQYTMKQISYYYQCKPLEILRYVRSTPVEQDEQQMSYEIENENQIEIPFLNLTKTQEFQTAQLKNTQYVPNYFTFNQCVYDLFNDIIDKIRPYGSRGKSIFTLQLSHSLKNEHSIRQQVFYRFYESSKYEFQADFLREELVHGDQGNFQIIYFVSMQVIESVYNESILDMYRVMRKKIFQS